jgi:uncharacterized protein YdeI (YjbR/CyaY-like superfamily)
MNIGKTLYVNNRDDWRNWLAANFDKEKEIWLILPNKQSDKPALLYNDAVEEALAFGWIDSTVKKWTNSPRRSATHPVIPAADIHSRISNG